MIKKALLGKIAIPREGRKEGPTTNRLKSGGEGLEGVLVPGNHSHATELRLLFLPLRQENKNKTIGQ